MFSVRGIGVAVSVSTCTSARSACRRSLSRTPKRCSSSTMMQAEVLEARMRMQQAMRGDHDVDRAAARGPPGLPAVSLPSCRSATAPRCAPASRRSGRGSSPGAAGRAAWSGTSTATCLPACTATKAARIATSVLPKPTSPQTMRSIGRALPRSASTLADRFGLVRGLLEREGVGEGLVVVFVGRQRQCPAAPCGARTGRAVPRPHRGSARRRACAPSPTGRCRACAAARSRALRRCSG